LPELKAPNAVTVPQAEPPRKSFVRILWNRKDYVCATVGIYECVKYVIEQSICGTALCVIHEIAVIAYIISYSVGKIAWSIVFGAMAMLTVIFGTMRIVQLLAYLCVPRSIFTKISRAIENIPLGVVWIAILPGAILGVVSVLKSWEPGESLSILFPITGAPMSLSAVYRTCQAIHKKVKILTADGTDS
jgi:hypothetical protein